MRVCFTLACLAMLAACSSGTGRSATPIGELRTACQQGDRSACATVRAHDGLL